MQSSRAVIISLHPEHAEKILDGTKKLEFRRVWAKNSVNTVVIYSTKPVQKIVAICNVKTLHYGSPSKLWSIANTVGGGLSRRALYSYFKGKDYGYAIEFDFVQKLDTPISPELIFSPFNAPQSFSYLTENQLARLELMSDDQKRKCGKVIFISGVHGVGKTSMCESYKDNPDITHASASQLIRMAKEDSLQAGTKNVKDIRGNQELLIHAVSKVRESGKSLLLDGHFALWDANKKPTPIETEVFFSLKIDAVIVVHDQPESIALRLSSRDKASLVSELDIKILQEVEIKRANEISSELKIPITLIQAFNKEEFDQKIINFLI